MYLLTHAIAQERHKALLAEAERDRRIAQARRNRTFSPAARTSWIRRVLRLGVRPPAAPVRPVLLRNGSTVSIRAIAPSDAPRLVEAFDRLSAASRRNRFLGDKQTLSAAELKRFTTVDHTDHEALIALSIDGSAVGVARFVRSAHDHSRAELAVTVIDAWQRRGLGHALLVRLAQRARQQGIGTFTALVADDNVAARALLHRFAGRVDVLDRDVDTTEYGIALTSRRAGTPERMPQLSPVPA